MFNLCLMVTARCWCCWWRIVAGRCSHLHDGRDINTCSDNPEYGLEEQLETEQHIVYIPEATVDHWDSSQGVLYQDIVQNISFIIISASRHGRQGLIGNNCVFVWNWSSWDSHVLTTLLLLWWWSFIKCFLLISTINPRCSQFVRKYWRY